MSQTIVIASRELRERSRIFLMAAAMAVLPFLAALLPAVSNDRPMAIVGTAGFIAVALAFGVAIAQGVSTVAGELVARRMTFYFTKPVSPAAVWFGKLFAALLTSVLCFAIIITPAILATGGSKQWESLFSGTRLLGVFAAGVVVLFLVSHLLSTIIRSRSGWIGVDFVCAAVTALALLYIARPLTVSAPDLWKEMLIAMGIAFVAILVVAPVWQLAQGRSDIRRSHAALSRAVWIPIAVVLLVAGAYVVLLRSGSPTSLKHVNNIEQVPGGSAVFISGTGRMRDDYHHTFIADAKSGKYVRLEAPAWWGTHFSPDGKVAGWLQALTPLARGVELELYTKRLDQPDAPIVATGLRSYGDFFAFSPDGSRVVLAKDATYSVHDLAANRILASAARPLAGQIFTMFFVDQNVVRLYQSPPNNQSQVDIYELDARTKTLTKTGAILTSNPFGLRVSRDGSRVLFPRSGILADGRTGAPVAQLPTTAGFFPAGFLHDGTIVVIKREQSQPSVLDHFAADGTKLREFTLPANFAYFVGELDAGKLILMARDKMGPPSKSAGDRRMLVADLASGRVVRTVNGISGPAANWTDPRTPQFRGDQPLVAANAEGNLVTWNPSTGTISPFPRP